MRNRVFHSTKVVAFALLGLSAIAQGAQYDALFPQSLTVCAATRFHTKNGGPVGGTTGHGAYYLHGACLDATSTLPKLRKCTPQDGNLADPNTGTGLSVSKFFSNVNWVGVPTKTFFFGGDHPKESVLNRETLNIVRQSALNRRLFKNIKVHDEYAEEVAQKFGGDPERFLAFKTVGQDYALDLARARFCVDIPLNEELLDEAIEHFNGYNHRAAEKGYQWNAYTNNCMHPVMAFLKHLGFSLFTLPMPGAKDGFSTAGNVVLSVLHHANVRELKQGELFRDAKVRHMMLEHQWSAIQAGTLGSFTHAFDPSKNEVYVEDLKMLVLPSPVGGKKRLEQIVGLAEFRELSRNVGLFLSQYKAQLLEAKLAIAKIEQIPPAQRRPEHVEALGILISFATYLDEAIKGLA